MELKKADDLFPISRGEEISKRNLFDLIQFSKVVGSSYWSGSASIIGNTPQHGINWIGLPPEVRAVIIKTRPGSYETDGWADDLRTSYRYSFKAKNGKGFSNNLNGSSRLC
jgi:putative restriction endonuclease